MTDIRHFRFVLSLTVIAFLISACATTARLYNLDTGEVLNASFENYGTGHGRITVATPDGIQLSGEYSTISGMIG